MAGKAGRLAGRSCHSSLHPGGLLALTLSDRRLVSLEINGFFQVLVSGFHDGVCVDECTTLCSEIACGGRSWVAFFHLMDGWNDPGLVEVVDTHFMHFVSRVVQSPSTGLDVGLMVTVAGVFWLQGRVGDGGGAAPTDTRLRECRRRSCVLSDQTSHVLS